MKLFDTVNSGTIRQLRRGAELKHQKRVVLYQINAAATQRFLPRQKIRYRSVFEPGSYPASTTPTASTKPGFACMGFGAPGNSVGWKSQPAGCADHPAFAAARRAPGTLALARMSRASAVEYCAHQAHALTDCCTVVAARDVVPKRGSVANAPRPSAWPNANSGWPMTCTRSSRPWCETDRRAPPSGRDFGSARSGLTTACSISRRC